MTRLSLNTASPECDDPKGLCMSPIQSQANDTDPVTSPTSKGRQQPETSPGNPKDPYQGLRRMFSDWKTGSIKGPSVGEPEREYDRAMMDVHSTYQLRADLEDKELIDRWNETLQIILIFAGLLSATITAFILAARPDLKPDPHDESNFLLRQLVSQFNSTALQYLPPLDQNSAAIALRTSAWWYGSLACSLTAGFGALLGKQWVLHFQSTPVWANSAVAQSRLREMRYQGITVWKFHTFIDLLPVLLQISVFLFLIGLVEYLSSTKLLFIISLAFLAVNATYFVVTLVAGAFSPSCPFKSPITDFLFQSMMMLLACLIGAVITPWGMTVSFSRNPRQRLSFQGVATRVVMAWRACVHGLFNLAWEGAADIIELPSTYEDSPSAFGVLCRWLHDRKFAPIAEEQMKAVATAIMSHPAHSVTAVLARSGSLYSFCRRILFHLDHQTDSEPVSILMGDTLWRLCVLSPLVLKSAQVACLGNGSRFGGLAGIIRHKWGDGRTGMFSFENMRWTTFTLYIWETLEAWVNTEPAHRVDRELILQELTTLVNLNLHPNAFSCVHFVPLAAIAVADSAGFGFKHLPCRTLRRFQAVDMLFFSLDLLSRHPTNLPPNKLVASVLCLASREVQTYRKLITSGDALHSDYLGDGKIPTTLIKMLRLGNQWWHSRDLETSRIGGRIVQGVKKLIICFLVEQGGSTKRMVAGLDILISLEGQSEIFLSYVRPGGSYLLHGDTLRILDYTLSLRRQAGPRGALLQTSGSTNSRTAPSTPSPEGIFPIDQHILPLLQQLLHDLKYVGRELAEPLPEHGDRIISIQTPNESHSGRMDVYRQIVMTLVLSVIVKGQHIFLPLAFLQRAGYDRLASDLQSISSSLRLPAGELLFTLHGGDPRPFKTFHRWSDLVAALQARCTELASAQVSPFNGDTSASSLAVESETLGLAPSSPALSNTVAPCAPGMRHNPVRLEATLEEDKEDYGLDDCGFWPDNRV